MAARPGSSKYAAFKQWLKVGTVKKSEWYSITGDKVTADAAHHLINVLQEKWKTSPVTFDYKDGSVFVKGIGTEYGHKYLTDFASGFLTGLAVEPERRGGNG